MSNKINSYYSKYGPGGRNCNCCGPAPSIRKKHDRIVKKREKRDARKNIMAELQEG